MIGYPLNGALMNAYCADTGAAQPTFQPTYTPFLARRRNLTEQQAREADRLRKMAKRLPDVGLISRGGRKAQTFLQQFLRHVANRMGHTSKTGFEHTDIEAAVCVFCDNYAMAVEDFEKWCGGPTSFLVGMKVGHSTSQIPVSNTSRAFFDSFIEAFSEPERNGIALEQGKIPETDLVKTCLEGLPEGTALQRFVERESNLDPERLGRLAGLTGMMWQLALVSVAVAAQGEEANPILNPAPQPTEKGGQRWSSGPAWVAAIAEFEHAHHGAPRTGTRGPASVARQIHTLLAKGRGDENDYDVRKLNEIQSGRKPLVFKAVEDICQTIEAAQDSLPDETLRSALSNQGDVKWEDQLLRLRIYGHIAGFMSYIERVWEYASCKLDNPTMLQDVHDVWQDWPLIYKNALDNHRKRLAEFGY